MIGYKAYLLDNISSVRYIILYLEMDLIHSILKKGMGRTMFYS